LFQTALDNPPVPGPHGYVEDDEGKGRMLGAIPVVLLQNDFGPGL